MKRYLILCGLIALAVAISCTKKMSPGTVKTPPRPTVTYAGNIKALVETKCTPCHVPAKGGFKTRLDTYDSTKKYIDDILVRIQLNPGEKGYMPFKFPKLAEADIAVFKKWKEEGLAE